MSLNRYQFTKTELGKLKTVKYPEFNKQPSDRYILSRDGDRLDILSNELIISSRQLSKCK